MPLTDELTKRWLEGVRAPFIAVLLLLCFNSLASAAIVVDGRGPDDSNRRPGLQNNWGEWFDVSGQRHPDPPDVCIIQRRFETLQAALFALSQGWLGNETEIRIVTGAPLPARYPVPSKSLHSPLDRGNIPDDNAIHRPAGVPGKIVVRGFGTSRAVITGGAAVVTVRARDVELKRLELLDGSSAGVWVDPPQVAGTGGPDLLLEDVVISGNGTGGNGSGIFVNASTQRYAIALRDTVVENNLGPGFRSFRSAVDLSVDRGARGLNRIGNNRGHGILMTGPQTTGVAPPILQFDFQNGSIEDNDGDGVRLENDVRLLIEDSFVRRNGGVGLSVRDLDARIATNQPVIRRTTVASNEGGGVQLVNLTGQVARIGNAVLIQDNKHWGMYLEAAGAELFSQVQIFDNKGSATSTGGGFGIRSRDSWLSLKDTEVFGNENTGIFATDTTMTVTGSEVDANLSDGITLENSLLEMSGGSVSDNTQTGISARSGSKVELTGSVSVNDNGGHGLFIRESELRAVAAAVNDNGQEGIFAIEGSDVRLEKSDIVNNGQRGINLKDRTVAVIGDDNWVFFNRGGGVKVEACPGNVVVRGNRIWSNETSGDGGGVLVYDPPGTAQPSNPLLLDNDIRLNTAQGSGGGIAVEHASARIRGTAPVPALIADNTSSGGIGGGIGVLSSPGVVEIETLRIVSNRATSPDAGQGRGGGIAVQQSQGVRIGASVIESNEAEHFGGGVFSSNSELFLGNPSQPNTILGNTVNRQHVLGASAPMGLGAGLYVSGTGSVRVKESWIYGNRGSGVHISGGGGHVFSSARIGVDSRGIEVPNQGHGVSILDSSGNRLFGNTIRASRDAGLWVGGAAATENDMVRTVITNNLGPGIVLWDGANRGLKPPVLHGENAFGVFGSVPPPHDGEVFLFEDPDGEGEHEVGRASVGADGSFLIGVAGPVVLERLTAVRLRQQNVSEFGNFLFNLAVDGVDDRAEMAFPGKAIRLNDDDDGAPPGPDLANVVIDAGTDADDLAVLRIERLPNRLNGGSVHLEIPPSGLRVFDDQGQRVLGPGLPGGPGPRREMRLLDAIFDGPAPIRFSVEGTKTGQHVVSLIYRDRTGQECGRDQVLISVYSIAGVEWIGAAVSADPTFSGGERFFEGPRLNQPTLRVTLEPPVPGVRVHLKLVDVDDPSTSVGPVDDETSGPDNGPAVSALRPPGRWTNPAGQASVQLLFEGRPGANFRVVASLEEHELTGLVAPQGVQDARVSDGNGNPILGAGASPFSPRASRLLTFWRRLHVLFHSMPGPPAGANQLTVAILQANRVATTRLVRIVLTTDLGLKDHELAGGAVRYLGTDYFIADSLTTTLPGLGDRTVIEIIAPGVATGPMAGAAVTVWDDDLTNPTLPGAPTPPVLPHTPTPATVASLQALFRPAFVEVVPEVASQRLIFAKNINTAGDLAWTFTAVTDLNSEALWQSHVGSAFQGHEDADLDPNGELGPLASSLHDGGIAEGKTLREQFGNRQFLNFSLIYRETLRESPRNEAQVIGHLLGQQFEATLADGGLMTPTDTGFAGPVFAPITLLRIRSASKP